MKAKEQEEREARLGKLRPSIRNLLKGNPNVHHYTTFPTADKLFAQHPIWQQAKIESERRLIFEEHVSELKQREMVCVFLLHRDHPTATHFLCFVAREQSITLQKYRKTCQSVQRIASRRTDKMADRAFTGTRIGSLEGRPGDTEAPYFGHPALFRGLQPSA